jgi:hypothetical protein
LDGVNGILMQQEPDSPTQDYWNRRAIASLANTLITVVEPVPMPFDNFRMNTRYGRYGAAYSMVGLRCFNEELSLLPKNPTEAKLQATSTWGESTEPT